MGRWPVIGQRSRTLRVPCAYESAAMRRRGFQGSGSSYPTTLYRFARYFPLDRASAMCDSFPMSNTHSFFLEVRSLRTGEWTFAGHICDAKTPQQAERLLRKTSAQWLFERREWRLVDKGPTPKTICGFTL